MSDSAERRAKRKLLAQAYSSLPSREVLQAASELERARMQHASQTEQMALQKGSLAVAVNALPLTFLISYSLVGGRAVAAFGLYSCAQIKRRIPDLNPELGGTRRCGDL